MLFYAFKLSQIIQNNQQKKQLLVEGLCWVKVVSSDSLLCTQLSRARYKLGIKFMATPQSLYHKNCVALLISKTNLCSGRWLEFRECSSLAISSWHVKQQSHQSLGNTLTNHLSPFSKTVIQQKSQFVLKRGHQSSQVSGSRLNIFLKNNDAAEYVALAQEGPWEFRVRGYRTNGYESS